MSWNLRSAKTSYPRLGQEPDDVGAGGAVELEPDLGHAEPRAAVPLARRRAATESSTSSASASMARISGSSTVVVVKVPPGSCRWVAPTESASARLGGVGLAQARNSSEHPSRSAGVGEDGGARPAPRTRWLAPAPRHQPPRAMPPTPMMGRSGSAAWTSCTARTATGWMPGPGQPAPTRPGPEPVPAGLRVDGHAEHRVHERDRLRAGALCGDGDRVEVGRRSGSARPTGDGRTPRGRHHLCEWR